MVVATVLWKGRAAALLLYNTVLLLKFSRDRAEVLAHVGVVSAQVQIHKLLHARALLGAMQLTP